MTVPSEIVAYIASKFPGMPKGEPHSLGSANYPTLAHILNLIEALPSGIITLKGNDLAEYGESVESIRYALKIWERGNGNHVCEKLPGRDRNINPLTYIWMHLSNLPDDVVAPTTADLLFIKDQQLREALRHDISGASRSFSAGDWKGCTVVSGSVVEALLLWAIDEHEGNLPGQVALSVQALTPSIFTGKTAPNPNKWDLHQLIEVSANLKIIKDETAAQCRIAKDFRNLIHPGRAMRLAQSCTLATALSALAAVQHAVNDLLKHSPKNPPKSPNGEKSDLLYDIDN